MSAPVSILPKKKNRGHAVMLHAAMVGATAVALYLAVRDVPFGEIATAVGGLSLWQILLVVLLNIAFHLVIGARWWLVARPGVPQARFLEMVAVRLGGFAISYFTPGPQLGGEPLQILYLRKRSASLARAAGTVAMDKLLELLANFGFLLVGGLLLLQTRLPATIGLVSPEPLVVIGLLLAWPPLHLLLLCRGRHPVSAVLGWLGPRPPFRTAVRSIVASEHLAGRFCRRRTKALLGGIALSILAGGIVVMEYGLIASFLGMVLTFPEMLTSWTASWLSFGVPLPGALGALEASQRITLGAFGVPASTALALVLVLRGRDLTFGSIGLLLAGAWLGLLRRAE